MSEQVAIIIAIDGDEYTIRMPDGEVKTVKTGKTVKGLGTLEWEKIPPGEPTTIDDGPDQPSFEMRSIRLELSEELKVKLRAEGKLS